MSKILNTAKKANIEQYDLGFQKSGRKKKPPIPTQHKFAMQQSKHGTILLMISNE